MHDPLAAPARPATAPRVSAFRALRLAATDIKLAHSVFALPFAIMAAFLSRPPSTPLSRFLAQLALVVLCMVLARTWAMLVNRLADRRIDASNPRTTRRLIASGSLPLGHARIITFASAVLFIGAASLFSVFFSNRWPVLLSVPTLAFIAFYSFTKRFTALCHVFLGAALAFSPIAAAIAIDPSALASAPALWFIAGMVLLWVAGFDVIYALQDVEFDLANRLHSIPSTLGPHGGIWVSRALHVGSFALLVLASRTEPRFGRLFFAAVAVVGVLLIAEHAVLAKRGKAGLDMAFFTINGVVSCLLGLAGVIDLAVM